LGKTSPRGLARTKGESGAIRRQKQNRGVKRERDEKELPLHTVEKKRKKQPILGTLERARKKVFISKTNQERRTVQVVQETS